MIDKRVMQGSKANLNCTDEGAVGKEHALPGYLAVNE